MRAFIDAAGHERAGRVDIDENAIANFGAGRSKDGGHRDVAIERGKRHVHDGLLLGDHGEHERTTVGEKAWVCGVPYHPPPSQRA